MPPDSSFFRTKTTGSVSVLRFIEGAERDSYMALTCFLFLPGFRIGHQKSIRDIFSSAATLYDPD
jgi:hypothetical protein